MFLALKYLAVLAFFLAGVAKLFRAKPLVDQFREFGLPSWTVVVIGSLEVAGALGLVLGATSFLAALGLALLMMGAVANHLKAGHSASKSSPAFLLFVLTVYLAYTLWSM